MARPFLWATLIYVIGRKPKAIVVLPCFHAICRLWFNLEMLRFPRGLHQVPYRSNTAHIFLTANRS
jgi:hypothetical protein